MHVASIKISIFLLSFLLQSKVNKHVNVVPRSTGNTNSGTEN